MEYVQQNLGTRYINIDFGWRKSGITLGPRASCNPHTNPSAYKNSQKEKIKSHDSLSVI